MATTIDLTLTPLQNKSMLQNEMMKDSEIINFHKFSEALNHPMIIPNDIIFSDNKAAKVFNEHSLRRGKSPSLVTSTTNLDN